MLNVNIPITTATINIDSIDSGEVATWFISSIKLDLKILERDKFYGSANGFIEGALVGGLITGTAGYYWLQSQGLS